MQISKIKWEHVLILAIVAFMLYYLSRCRCSNNGFSVGGEYKTCSDFWELSTCLEPLDCQSDGLDGRRNHTSKTVDFADIESIFDDTLKECCESCEAASPVAEAIRVATEGERMMMLKKQRIIC